MSARVATVAVLTAAVSLGAKQDVWVASKMSPELWTRVRAVLEPELAPDDPAHTPRHAVALRYKRLVRVAGDEVVLALIGMRENERQPARSALTAAYSVDLPSGRKELLGRYALWRFVKWAHFESHSADAVFSYQTCDECEAERFVASFTYDSNARAWKLRRWPEEATQILIGADPEPDAQADLRCLFGVADYTGDAADDIATWCRTRSVKTQQMTNEVFAIYSIGSSGPTKQVVTGSKAQTLRGQLCRQNPRASACR